MTTCPSCSLDGPCTDTGCTVRVYRCPACSAPFPSRTAADRCADLDDARPPFTD